jgi:hypothetical protein
VQLLLFLHRATAHTTTFGEKLATSPTRYFLGSPSHYVLEFYRCSKDAAIVCTMVIIITLHFSLRSHALVENWPPARNIRCPTMTASLLLSLLYAQSLKIKVQTTEHISPRFWKFCGLSNSK